MTTDLMSDILRDSICEQIGHEKENANIYLFVCGFLRNKGLDNLAKIFMEQHNEETGHSLMFFDLLTDMGADIRIPEINGVDLTFNVIGDISSLYLEREIITTNSINAIKKLSVEQGNPVIEEFMRKMIVLQQKEYEESTTFQDKADLFKEWWQVGLWNESLS